MTERIIPERARRDTVPERDALKTLLLKALDGHGWAQMGTLADTWRLTKRRKLLQACLEELRDAGTVAACSLEGRAGLKGLTGWIRSEDLDLASRLEAYAGDRVAITAAYWPDYPLWLMVAASLVLSLAGALVMARRYTRLAL